MTLKDARRIKAGTKINHNSVVGLSVKATGPAVINGRYWSIPVDGETSTKTGDGQFWIIGTKGFCWTVEERGE